VLQALYLPVAAMLIGLMLRGVAFELRMKAEGWHAELWNWLFWFGSFLASLAQGFMLGRYITGFETGAGYWLFALLVGASLCGGYVLLGASWLVLRTEGELQRKARAWARWGLLWVALGVALVSVATPLASELNPGDSLAVNGVCLTVILCGLGEVHADVGPETARVTTFSELRRDQRVNLERPLRIDARLGGHLVQGHVDGIGTIEEIRRDADCHWLTVSFPPALAPFFIRKGSVTVDGVSLTIAGLGDSQFDVQIIPFTWEHTSLCEAKAGDKVNLECDMIGKYVLRAMELRKQ